MFRLKVLKRVMPVIVSVCVAVQSVPFPSYAAEDKEEEIMVEESGEISEESCSEAEAAQQETTAEVMEASEMLCTETTTMETETAAAKEAGTQPHETEETELPTETLEETFIEEKSIEEAQDLKAEDAGLTLNIEAAFSLKRGEEQWYSFAAPEDGNYSIDIVRDSSSAPLDMELYEEPDGDMLKYITCNSVIKSIVHYMDAGQTVYIRLYTDYSQAGGQICVTRERTTTRTTKTDSGYTAENDDLTAALTVETGCKAARLNVEFAFKEGAELSDTYVLYARYQKKGDTALGGDFGVNLWTTNGNCQASLDIKSLTAPAEYQITLYVTNSSGEVLYVLLPDNAPLTIITKNTEEKVIFLDSKATYSSVTFTVEAVSQIGSAAYAKTSDLENKTAATKTLSGIGEITFSALVPETEYCFYFYDTDNKLLGQATETTAAFPGTISCTTSELYTNKIQLKVSVSDYQGTATQFYVTADLYDDEGSQLGTVNRDIDITDGAGGETLSWSSLLAGSKYTVKLCVMENGAAGKSTIEEQELVVTTLESAISADAITLTLSQDEDTPTVIDYVVKISDYNDSISGTLKYRINNSGNSYSSKSVSIQNGRAIGKLTGLQEGKTYEFVLIIDGVAKKETFRCGGDAWDPILSDDTSVHDTTLTFRLPDDIVDENAVYTVRAYYMENGGRYWLGESRELTADNNYIATVNTAVETADSTSGQLLLTADTEYTFQWVLSISTESDTEVSYTYPQTIHTEKGTADAVQKQLYINRADFELTLGGRTENLTATVYLYTWLKEGDGSFQKRADAVKFTKENDYKITGYSLTGLQENTSYEVSLRDKNESEYALFSFTTNADNRTITLNQTETAYYSFTMSISFSGNSLAYRNYALLYYREKGTEGAYERTSAYIDTNYYQTRELSVSSYNGAALKDNTTYEYILGIGDDDDTARDELAAVIEGEVTTQKDERSLTLEAVDSGYSYVKLAAKTDKNIYNTALRMHLFYRKKDTQDWTKADELWETDAESDGKELFITGLNAGTAYEYEAVLTDSGKSCKTPDAAEDTDKLVSGEFTTKTADYTLFFEPDEEKCSYNTEIFNIRAEGTASDARLDAALTLGNGQRQTVTLEQTAGYAGTVAFTDLSADTQYTVVTAVLGLEEAYGDNQTTYAELLCLKSAYTFRTKRNEAVEENPTEENPTEENSTEENPTQEDPTEENPTEENPRVYAVTNVQKKLSAVPIPEELGSGWSWKEPDTVLYNIPVNADCYTFEAVRTNTDGSTDEKEIDVYISTVTGVLTEDESGYNGVLMADGSDAIALNITPKYMGTLTENAYTTSISSVKNLTITKDEKTGMYRITAKKAGKYTIKPQIIVNGTVAAAGKYTLTAVTKSPVETISLTSKTEQVVISDDMISFDLGEEKTFELSAAAIDREGSLNTDTKLQWKITDSSVAAVKADKTTRSAAITIKGEGHAVLEVTAKDAAGASTQLKLEVRNHKPRVDASTATVNKALDYNDSNGRELSGKLYGKIEIVPVYGEGIQSVSLKNNLSDSTEFDIQCVGGNEYVIVPKSENIAAGTYSCTLLVRSSKSTEAYTYPVTVKVIDNHPKVMAKAAKTVNLFYITDTGQINVTLENDAYDIESIVWESASGGSGFAVRYQGSVEQKPNVKMYDVLQTKVKVENGAVADNADVGMLRIRLKGVKDEYIFENFKISSTYQKPSLKTVDAVTKQSVSSIVPSIKGMERAQIVLYDTLKKQELHYEEMPLDGSGYDSITCDNAYITLKHDEVAQVGLVYSGASAKESFFMTVSSPCWRDPLTVKHTIQAVQPKAVLLQGALTINTNYMKEVSTTISLKDCCGVPNFANVAIEGADVRAKTLLEDGSLQLTYDSGVITARLNKLKSAEQGISNGTYSFKLTPYYTDKETGAENALNTVKLKLTITDRAAAAQVKAAGSLDLALTPDYDDTSNSIALTAKFSNLGSGYKVTAARLSGEYSRYFKLAGARENDDANPVYYLQIANMGKLRAGRTYNMSVTYTVQMAGGELLWVTSNKFKVKPKQTAPKITVKSGSQTLYAASDISRSYTVCAPNTKYVITAASGSLDINKDGKADIQVTLSSASGRYGYLNVSITDRDAAKASAGGKSYSIPVTVQVQGRDGLSKDAVVSIKVKIKR